MSSGIKIGTLPRSTQESIIRELSELRSEVEQLKRDSPIKVGTGSPTAAVRDGSPYGQIDIPRLWVRINGNWRYTALS